MAIKRFVITSMTLALLAAAGCGDGELGSQDSGPATSACVHAYDCKGKPGCAAGCVCKGNTCQGKLTCTLASEFADCGIGGLCYQNICIPVPACVTQTDCNPYKLYCDPQFKLCGRTPRCTKSSECSPPASYCNPTTRLCETPNCINGGLTCKAPKSVCNAQGVCVAPPTTPPTGGCSADADCCPEDKDKDQTCKAGEVEYCDIPKGKTAGTCKTGCNSNAACAKIGLKSCNGLHQCIKKGKHGDSCESELKDCRAGYYCCPILKKCFERCTKDKKCPDTDNKCIKVFINDLCVG